MGMFDKDKEIGQIMEQVFQEREEFVLWAATVAPDPVPTEIGDAEKTVLSVSRLSAEGRQVGERFDVNTLASAVAGKAKDAEPDDFPAVVTWLRVHSKAYNTQATVLSFVREYDPPAGAGG